MVLGLDTGGPGQQHVQTRSLQTDLNPRAEVLLNVVAGKYKVVPAGGVE